MRSFTTNLLVALSVAATSLGSVHHVQVRSHNALAKRMEEGNLSKRFAAHRVTWYPTNTGADACTGRNHGDYDNIVALNIPQWGNLNARSQHCGRTIRITANGKSHTGVIQDACASCYNWGEIDLTKGLFEKFASLDQGVFDATWEFVDGDGGDDDDDKPPPPPPKKTPKKPKPTPTPTPAKFIPKPPKKKSSSSSKSKAKTHEPSPTKKSTTVSASSTPAVVVPVPSPTPSVSDTTSDSGVGNAGANPNSDSDSSLSGGISSDSLTGGAASITFNKFVAGAAALVLAFQAL